MHRTQTTLFRISLLTATVTIAHFATAPLEAVPFVGLGDKVLHVGTFLVLASLLDFSSGVCPGCHDAHHSNYPKILRKDIPAICYDCHDQKKFKGKSGHTNIGLCMGCHNPHSSELPKLVKGAQPDLCYSCHEKEKFNKKYVHSIINIGGCTSCHTPHISNDPSLLLKKPVDLCLSCHPKKSDGRHIVNVPGRRCIR